jgi:uncharacterized protein (UPF0264 family)
VSVRSGAEALAALAGGAAIIDVKEPLEGSLGRAAVDVWREVQAVVPAEIPISVALGELNEWPGEHDEIAPRDAWTKVTFCKIGLSDAPPDWKNRWHNLRERVRRREFSTPSWVAVIYMDWQAARAPDPDSIIEAALSIDECRGILFDTWDKSNRFALDWSWKPRFDRVRESGRLVALAGSLDVAAIVHLAPLLPDIFAVRGSACVGGDRLGPIDRERVSMLARAAQGRVKRVNL